jgi:hypothetical protein
MLISSIDPGSISFGVGKARCAKRKSSGDSDATTSIVTEDELVVSNGAISESGWVIALSRFFLPVLQSAVLSCERLLCQTDESSVEPLCSVPFAAQ